MKIFDSKIFLVFGMGASKFAPLLFGLYLSRKFGLGVYAAFVLLLNYSAAISSFASMGATPRILRASATDDPVESIIRACAAGFLLSLILIAFSAFYWLAISNHHFFGSITQPKNWEFAVISMYCMALTLLSMTIPLYSHEHNWFMAGASGISAYAVAIISGLTFGSFLLSYVSSITAYVTFFAIASMVVFFLAQFKYYAQWVAFISSISMKKMIIYGLSNVKASLFSGVFLGGFYYVNWRVNQSASVEGAALYSLAFQLFSVSIFFPSIFGSIIIPIISRGRDEAKKSRMHTQSSVAYVAISITMASLVFFSRKIILSLYHIHEGGASDFGLMFMQAAAVAASFSAVYLQRFTAEGRFWQLLVISLAWFVSLLSTLHILGPTAVGAAASFLVSYSVAGACYVLFSSSLGRSFNKRRSATLGS